MSSSRSLTWTVSLILIAAATLGLSRAGAVSPLQGLAGRIFGPLVGLVHAASAPVADLVSNAGDVNSLKSENRRLQAENERLSADNAQLRQGQADALQQADLDQTRTLHPNDAFVTASVVARDPSNVRDSVQIDKGTQDGLKQGMVVLGKGGALAGTVISVHTTYAWVKLITDPNSDVNVVDQLTSVTGTATGGLSHRLEVKFVGAGSDIKAGDTITTSGIGGHFPKGILIGRVSQVDSAPTNPEMKVTVEPSIRPGTEGQLLVMTSFLPARVGIGP